MNKKEEYQQSIGIDLKRTKRTLAAFKVQSKSLTDADRIRNDQWIEELQKKTEAAQANLHEWSKADGR